MKGTSITTGKVEHDAELDFTRYNWRTEDIIELDKALDRIISFLDKRINRETAAHLFDDCYSIVEKVALPAIPIDTNYILRARANYQGEVFKEQQDISYNTKCPDKIKLGRFNLEKESMFYAVVPSSEQGRLIATVALECCKELVDEDNINQYQYFTFGKWGVNDNLWVLNLCLNDGAMAVNEGLRRTVTNYLDTMESNLQPNAFNFFKKYWKFFSDLSCTKHEKDQQYIINNAFMHAVWEHYNESFNGIIYPSSMTKHEGINLVLTPSAVDRHLTLSQAFMYKILRDPSDRKSYHGFECSRISDVIDKELKISGIY